MITTVRADLLADRSQRTQDQFLGMLPRIRRATGCIEPAPDRFGAVARIRHPRAGTGRALYFAGWTSTARAAILVLGVADVSTVRHHNP